MPAAEGTMATWIYVLKSARLGMLVESTPEEAGA